jgi:hypothetical protein
MKTTAMAFPMTGSSSRLDATTLIRSLVIKLATSIENFFVSISPNPEITYEDFERLENKRTAHQMRQSSF